MRRCLALDLKDDAELIARYEAWHRPGAVPQAVVRSIREAGILEMEIWRVEDRLFMVVEAGPDFSPQAKAAADMASRDVRAWERLMSAFQKPLTGAAPDEKWRDMRRIFALSEQP
ncbi:L-rhamnose mutarotase [Caulobacter flavus]|uniref:L-rhamnose mutarotase n=1 Tax=Caulobacter flavus TaxID=1679497 RepID=A0A2N5CLK4_9CAUL|nr:L-rhamnose mutarotase [Caulobacter flavus]AYV48888.1 L-rhamnose mutarotase [Caulobacter flavus]PLR06655.1 L-rhamnose mutarotase [Caulobacter flavus]